MLIHREREKERKLVQKEISLKRAKYRLPSS